MIIEGTIEDLVFRNASNGYTVALLSSQKNLITIVGKMLDIKVGQSVRLVGSYVNNNKYGEQFSFDDCTIITPNTSQEIEKYLSSGLIEGVGEVTAHRIVEYFGSNSLEVIELNPEKLAEVKGISKNKAQNIGKAYQEIKKLERVVMFLQKYDITTNMSLKIYDVYGENTISVLEENPYKLVEDVDGIGFSSADKIAESMGVDKTSEFRMRAGLVYTLSEACEKNGHTFLYQDNLVESCLKILGLEEAYAQNILKVLDDMVFDRAFMLLKQYSNAVMLQKYYQIELSVAKKLAFLAYTSLNENINLESEINEFEQVNKIKFHEDQKIAITSAIANGVSVITGGPGTGKTTIVKCILSILRAQNKKVILVAPTGRAAKRLQETTNEDAKTIHRALELDHFGNKTSFKFNEKNPLDVDCVIVDEFSMVDVNLANCLLKALPRDAKLIIVGDKDQLPSVGAGNVLSDIISSEKFVVSFLTKIFRQDSNSLIISNAHLINEGEMPVLDNSSCDFFYENKNDTELMLKSIVELVQTRLPNYLKISPSKIQVLSALKAGACGVENINRSLQQAINPPAFNKPELFVGSLILRVNDKVMQTSNNYDMVWHKGDINTHEEGYGVFNGDIGTIESINFQTGECLVVFDDGKVCNYSRVDLPQLSLAYAITIHKSQGCEFDAVVLPVVAGAGIIMTKNLLYTAVTRAKKLVVLLGEKKNISRMVHNTFTAKRFTMLKAFLLKECENMKEVYGE